MRRTLQSPVGEATGGVPVPRRGRRSRWSVAPAAVAACLLLPGAAGAAHSSIGLHNVSNSDGADVHAATARSPHGPYIGHLFRGDGFRVKEVKGEWCGGSAGGHVDRDGWVLCKDLNDI